MTNKPRNFDKIKTKKILQHYIYKLKNDATRNGAVITINAEKGSETFLVSCVFCCSGKMKY